MRWFYALFALGCLGLPGCTFNLPLGLGDDRGKLSGEVVEKADHFWTLNEILMIPLSGLVDIGGERATLGEPGMLVGLKDQLKAAEENPQIKAVILRVDSPGGSVTASDLIYQEIKRFKEKERGFDKHKIPVLVEMIDLAASGGFYISMPADEIYALPTTITGSIGVITMLPGIKSLSDKIGLEMRVIKSGANKDAGSFWREMTPEQREIFQGLIDKDYQLFLKVILDNRQAKGLTPEKLKALADGRVFDAQTALDNHLIDGIKYPQEVFERAKQLAGIKDARLVTYEYPFAYRGNLYARAPAPEPQTRKQSGGGDFNLLKLDLGALSDLGQGPRFMYLCLP